MARTCKVAVTIDRVLLDEAERLRRTTAESRSAVFARALRTLLHAEQRRRDIDRYVEAYQEHPETAEEVAFADRLAREGLSSVPWEDS